MILSVSWRNQSTLPWHCLFETWGWGEWMPVFLDKLICSEKERAKDSDGEGERVFSVRDRLILSVLFAIIPWQEPREVCLRSQEASQLSQRLCSLHCQCQRSPSEDILLLEFIHNYQPTLSLCLPGMPFRTSTGRHFYLFAWTRYSRGWNCRLKNGV